MRDPLSKGDNSSEQSAKAGEELQLGHSNLHTGLHARAGRMPSSLLQLQRTIGNRATAQLMKSRQGALPMSSPVHSPVIQRAPSDFAREFSSDPLLNLSLLNQLKYSHWNTYLIHVKPYFTIDDDDEIRQLQVFPNVYEKAITLGNSYRDNFTEPQKVLSDKIKALLLKEKLKLYRGEGIDSRDPTLRAADPAIKGGQGDRYADQIDPYHMPLWPRGPQVEDVKQGNLGDCYLIAAIASVVKSDPEQFIKNMKDNLDGTVTVKLYEDDGSPVNIVINKSTVSNGHTRDQYAKGLLWVQMLEKAYAAAGFTGKRELPNRMGASYEGIAGGAGDVALAHLTGKDTKSYNIGTRRQSVAEKINKRLAATVNNLKAEYREADKVLAKLRETGLKSSDKYKDTVREQDAIYAKIEGIQGPIGNLGGLLSLNYVSNKSLATFAKESNGPPELGRALFEETHLPSGQPLLPGELGSNEYGADEWELYQKIKTALDTGQAVTVSSKTSIVDAENEEEATKGFSAGETMASGLVAKHEYSVLDYLPKRPVGGVPLKAHIRNPWGSYGRKYVQKGNETKGVADKAGTGAFWIDMADMVSFFQTLSYTAPRPPVLPPARLLAPIPVPSDDAKKEIIRGKIYSSSVQDLYRAIIETAEDRGAEDFAADLVTAYKTHSPFASKTAMIDRFVAVMGGKRSVAQSIAEYLLDNTD